MAKPDFTHEDTFSGAVCGIDEVGRGPLAGPVVAAAVIIDRDRIPAELLGLINDSKKVTAARRDRIYRELPNFAAVSVAECSVEEIDDINILQAALKAMHKAYDGLPSRPLAALVDGNKAPKLDCRVKTVIGGDAVSLSIAAASIMAKVHRDNLMQTYAIEFPHYGWEKNAGYGTQQHLKAIEIHGITRFHRRSFAPIKKYA